MDSPYLSITDDDKLTTIANAVVARETELFHYGVNIANYEAMIETLPGGGVPADADDATREQYAWRDRLRDLLKSERSEQWKSRLVYDALLKNLPGDEARRTALIEAAKVRRAAQQGA